MRPRLVVRRMPSSPASSRIRPSLCRRTWSSQPFVNSVKTRPVIPFLAAPKESPSVARSFTSQRKAWLKHEAKLVIRYSLCLWGILGAGYAIKHFLGEEQREREFPTPHEWSDRTRRYLRNANACINPKPGGMVDWPKALGLARTVVLRAQVPEYDGQDVIELEGVPDSPFDFPTEFQHCDITAKSEEWRRGYFEALMLAAKAAEQTDGWLRDATVNVIAAPEFVIGPSNPRPRPVPPGHECRVPREENCKPAYPSADNFYMKLLATKGFTPRQMMQGALEYAGFLEYKGQLEAAKSLYDMALAEATQGMPPFSLPYDPKTLVLKDGGPPASMNVLDTLTAIAGFKARNGDVSAALPMYISLLKMRRSLSDNPPPARRKIRRRKSLWEQMTSFLNAPQYPPPPPNGFQPPWRSPKDLCQEAALLVNIGEILYATSSKNEGVAWTRDGVDLAEEKLRELASLNPRDEAKKTCRECLGMGLGNWSKMVANLAAAEEEKKQKTSKSAIFSLWSGSKEIEGRWAAEEAVVRERLRRTKELMEEIAPPNTILGSLINA